MDCSPPGSSSVHGIFQARILVGCHFLLQGVCLTQGSTSGLQHCRQTFYPLSHQGVLKASQHRDLPAVEWGQLLRKKAASSRAHISEYSPVLLPPLFLSPQWATAIPWRSFTPGGTPKPEGRSGPGSYEVTAFPCPVHMRPCLLPSKSVVCLSPVKCLGSRSTGIQSQILCWGFLLPVPDAQTGDSDVELRTVTPMGEPLWYNYFLFLAGMGFDYTTKVPLLLPCCSLSLDTEYVFSWGVVFFVDGCSTVVILVFLWEEVSSSPLNGIKSFSFSVIDF